MSRFVSMSRALRRTRSLRAACGAAGLSTLLGWQNSSIKPSASACSAFRRLGALSGSTGGPLRSRRWHVPPPSSLVNVGGRVVDFFENGGDAPYLLYVYKP